MKILPWLIADLQAWQTNIIKQQVPHALLLSSAKGLGKINLAMNMAHVALCENLTEQGVCQQCSACHLFNSDNHPDLIHIHAESSTIKVDQIRQLSQKINLSTTRSQHKVIIIEDAEQMNKSAANALLKTLEEPPAKVIIILTTSEIGRLLPTIKSRCVKQTLPLPANKDSINWLAQKSSEGNISTEKCQLALIMAAESPLIALQILQNDTSNKVLMMLDDLTNLSRSNKTILEVSNHWFKQELFKNLNYCAALFLSLLKVKTFNSNTNTNVINSNQQLVNFTQHILSQQQSETNLLEFVHQIFIFMQRQQTPLKTELLLEELLIKWQKSL